MVRRIPHIIILLLALQPLLHAQSPAPKDSLHRSPPKQSQNTMPKDSLAAGQWIVDTLPEPKRRDYWVAAGFGASAFAWGVVGQFYHVWGVESISFRVSYLHNIFYGQYDELDGLTIHYGRQIFEHNFIGRVALGGGYFNGTVKGNKINTVGGEFVAEAFWHTKGLDFITKHTDIGVGLIGTVSAGSKFFVPGIALAFYIGHFQFFE